MPTLEMLVNHVSGEESRIALLTDGKLEELYTERTSAALNVGSIYRGRVTNVEPSIQAAFVDFGGPRAGFLHITDLHPRYFPGSSASEAERVGHKTPRRERPPIQNALKRGQPILVQVIKEGIGTKGPTLTSYLSVPGRYLVMMPNMERHGVSRKIEDQDKRREMHRILDELDPPEGLGFIVRTAGLSQTKTELKRDLQYLLRLWKDIEARSEKGRGPAELYTESDLVIRTLRDVLTPAVKRVVVDDRLTALRARDFLRIVAPRSAPKVIHYDGGVPLFDAFGVEQQIDLINMRQVPLACGGSLVIDQTEALVAIDVNSGKFRDAKDSEESAYRTNLEAVEEIARQLRLRDLGGLIVLDLIDMYAHRHRREVEQKFKDCIKNDRARTKVLRISELGMMEMTRQRMRPSLKRSVYNECPSCSGSGHVLSPESAVLQVMRRLAVALSAKPVARVDLVAHPEVLAALLNRRRKQLVDLELRAGKKVTCRADASVRPDHFELLCYNDGGGQVELERLPKPPRPQFSRKDEIVVADLKELDALLADAEANSSSESTDQAGAAGRAERARDSEGAGDVTGGGEESAERKRRRRRRRRGGRRGEGEVSASGAGESQSATAGAKTSGAAETKSSGYVGAEDAQGASAEAEGEKDAESAEAGGPKRRRRRRGGRRKKAGAEKDGGEPVAAATPSNKAAELATRIAAPAKSSSDGSSTESAAKAEGSSKPASSSGSRKRRPSRRKPSASSAKSAATAKAEPAA